MEGQKTHNGNSNPNSTTKPLLGCMVVAHDIHKQGFSKWLLAHRGHGVHLGSYDRSADGGNIAKDMGGCPFPRLQSFFRFEKLYPHKTSLKKKVLARIRTMSHA